MNRMRRKLSAVSAAMLIAGCGQGDAPVAVKLPRPVTVIELRRTVPRPTSQLTGSIASWKTEQMGFQVQGRVASVLEPGRNIRGRTVDETGREITEGTVIAELEKERYDLKLAVAEAQQQTAAATAEAKESELKNVVPQQILAAQASVTLTQEEFKRIEQLAKRGAATQAERDRAKAQLDTAQANFDQAGATEKVTKAELLSLQAQEKEAVENVKQAKTDLRDTVLRSPFHGQIAEVHQIPGGYVQAGAPVVTVQMMDPISIEVAVSAETDARLNYNDIVNVYAPDSETAMEAMVYEKATIADPATRTFTVTLLVRNDQIEVGLPEAERGSNRPRVRRLLRLFTETGRRAPPYYVDVDALHQDADGYFVWRVANAAQVGRSGTNGSMLQLQKVRVTPGEKRLPYLQVATMRELTDIGDLDPQKDLLAGAFFDADGKQIPNGEATKLLKDDGEVPYVRERWLLRPGDIVRVDLQVETPAAGFYVPMNLILEEAGKSYIFTVDAAGEAVPVKRIEVKVLDAVGTRRRIEAAGGEALGEGMKVVDAGALFLTDGEKVKVVEGAEAGQ